MVLYVYGGNVAPEGPALSSLQNVDIGYLFSSVQEGYTPLRIIQSYPNPFTTSTTIEYELKQPEKVTLTIYDYLGKLIYQIDKNQIKGKQQLIWNANGLPDGIYYFRLQAANQIANGKMMKVAQ